ncbi:MAG: LysM peptidoglycan-binding domain-containing protein [Ruminococcaceae bacterium]|nr:LysM peptidoglycan-binding domain-containing protein [Oscillospiraceae bacterium]
MKTSSKLRRLQRIRKLRRQRRVFFLVLTLVLTLMASSVFSSSGNDNEKYIIVSVTVQPGDTLWSIAKEYKPDGKDLREFVYEIADNNGIDDCNIYCGQTIYVPVEAD